MFIRRRIFMNSIPTVTKNLLIINVLCFFGGVVAMKYGIDLNDLLGLHFLWHLILILPS